MTTKTTTSTGWMAAKLSFVWVEGASPPVYKTSIVRDRHTGRLAEVPLAPCEHPPIDEGDDGVTHVFANGEKVTADHPAVAANPQYFVPASAP